MKYYCINIIFLLLTIVYANSDDIELEDNYSNYKKYNNRHTVRGLRRFDGYRRLNFGRINEYIRPRTKSRGIISPNLQTLSKPISGRPLTVTVPGIPIIIALPPRVPPPPVAPPPPPPPDPPEVPPPPS